MASAESILFQINSTNYTQATPFTVYKPQAGNSGFVTTLKLTVNLNSIPETNFPYIPDDTPPNTLEEILNEAAATAEFREIILFFKKGTGNWMERASLRIFNKEPYYDIPLIRLFSDANTIDVCEDFSLGIQVKIGNVLTSADTILVWGSAVEEKKNNGNEELAARIEALELALAGRLTGVPASTLLGRNVGTGVIELIPQSTFVTPAQSQAAIDQAIIDWVGASPANLNTLLEISAALANNPNFATTITDLIATKAPLNTSLQLTNRSNTVAAPFDANNWTNTFFAAVKWLDGGYTNLNVPINTGMVIQFDSLFLTGVKDKYRVQIYFSSGRYFVRIEVAGAWGPWREISTVAVS